MKAIVSNVRVGYGSAPAGGEASATKEKDEGKKEDSEENVIYEVQSLWLDHIFTSQG